MRFYLLNLIFWNNYPKIQSKLRLKNLALPQFNPKLDQNFFRPCSAFVIRASCALQPTLVKSSCHKNVQCKDKHSQSAQFGPDFGACVTEFQNAMAVPKSKARVQNEDNKFLVCNKKQRMQRQQQQHMGIYARHDPDFNSIKAKPPDMNENTRRSPLYSLCLSLSLWFVCSKFLTKMKYFDEIKFQLCTACCKMMPSRKKRKNNDGFQRNAKLHCLMGRQLWLGMNVF